MVVTTTDTRALASLIRLLIPTLCSYDVIKFAESQVKRAANIFSTDGTDDRTILEPKHYQNRFKDAMEMCVFLRTCACSLLSLRAHACDSNKQTLTCWTLLPRPPAALQILCGALSSRAARGPIFYFAVEEELGV